MELEATATTEGVETSAGAAAAGAEGEAIEYELEAIASWEWVAAAVGLRLGVERINALIVLPPLLLISQHLKKKQWHLIEKALRRAEGIAISSDTDN